MIKKEWYWIHALMQCFVAVVFICLVLMLLNKIVHTKIILASGASTLASSAFLVFAVPSSAGAKPFKIIGGYIIAIFVGEAIRLCINFMYVLLPNIYPSFLFEIAASFSVGLTILLMILLKLEHPPAAGLAIIIVLDICHFGSILTIFFGALILTIIRTFFRNYLIDLI